MKPEHDNTTDIGVCQGCLTDAEAEVKRLNLQVREMTRLLEVTNMYHCGETCGVTDHNDDCLLAQEYIKRQTEKRVDQGKLCERCGEVTHDVVPTCYSCYIET